MKKSTESELVKGGTIKDYLIVDCECDRLVSQSLKLHVLVV